MKAHDLFENAQSKALGCVVALTAAGTGDATELTGEAIDTLGFKSAKLVIACKAILTEAKLLKIKSVKIAESDDGSSFGSDETLVDSDGVTVLTGGAGGSTEYGSYELKIDLSALEARARYLRFKFTPDLDASGTDTAIVAGTLELGGAVVKPVDHNEQN